MTRDTRETNSRTVNHGSDHLLERSEPLSHPRLEIERKLKLGHRPSHVSTPLRENAATNQGDMSGSVKHRKDSFPVVSVSNSDCSGKVLPQMTSSIAVDQHQRPALFLVVTNDEPRTCAQSTSGHSSSHVTSPLDSRSMLIAKDSLQGRKPYATFLRCPAVVPQRSAKSSRSIGDKGERNFLRSMPDYHHSVTEKATPIMEFTKWCQRTDNMDMDPETRRQNLRRVIDERFGGNLSAFARAFDPPKSPSYVSDLLRQGAGKSFGEKAARGAERAAGLIPGQLDIPNSPLRLDDTVRNRAEEELRMEIRDMDLDEKSELLEAARKIKSRRMKRRRTG
jgi:hypothetical protein